MTTELFEHLTKNVFLGKEIEDYYLYLDDDGTKEVCYVSCVRYPASTESFYLVSIQGDNECSSFEPYVEIKLLDVDESRLTILKEEPIIF